jgi:hypothetical protein
MALSALQDASQGMQARTYAAHVEFRRVSLK